MNKPCLAPISVAIAMLLAAAPAAAQDGAAAETAKPAGIWERDTLTGDWGGTRTTLVDAGVTLGATEISEVLGNVSGGNRRGFDYMGRTEAVVDLDLDKILGWHSALIHVNGYQIHGRGLSTNNLGGNLLGPSNIEATRTTRLFDAYYQQSVLDDKVSIRAGQIAADDEFITSQYAGTFINSTFGWPGIMSNNLPDGGPAYPLATPGLRAKYTPTDAISWQTGLFNGKPAGAPGGAPSQIRNRAGTTFSTDQDVFVISEVAYAVAADKDRGTVPASYKLGGWYHSGKFPDQRTGALKVNDYGLHGVVDQMLLSKPGTDDQGLAGFVRMGLAPDDRNLVSAYADAGLNYKGPFEGRDGDIIGVAVSYAGVGSHAVDASRDYNTANPTATRPVRDYEAAIELTYQYVAAPWWSIQPDAQYIFHPGGNAANPAAAATVSAPAMKDAAIVGVRTTVKF